jgi:hypothetical protein
MATAELINTMQHALESDGTFALLRAQLRASVMKVMEDNSSAPRILHNPAYVGFSSTEEGQNAIHLVRDLMEKLSLTQSLKVFDIETGIVSSSYFDAAIYAHKLLGSLFVFLEEKKFW